MHIVYKLIFDTDSLPNSYIGSKSNAKLDNGRVYSGGKEYKTSSKHTRLLFLFEQNTGYTMMLLGEYEEYVDALKAERQFQIENNVVKSSAYFNRALACENNYTNPDYATYTNGEKTVRLLRDDLDVLNGSFFGVTKGRILSESEKKNKSRPGKENYFYGKTHSEDSKLVIGKKNKESQQKYWDALSSDNRKKRTSHLSSAGGWVRSDEFLESIKGCVNMKSPTGEIKRIKKEEIVSYTESGWVNALSGIVHKTKECPHCKKHVNGGNYKRWHGDSCKTRPNDN